MINSKLFNLLVKVIVWAFFVTSLLWMSKALLLGYYPDFNTQYLVPRLVLSGINPYSGSHGLYTPQVYPPTTVFLYLPFTFLSIKTASYLFTFLSIGFLLSSLILLARIFERKVFSIESLFLMSLVFISFPVKFTLGMGQINMLILLLLVISLYFLKIKREYFSGILLGCALVIKMFPIFLPVNLVLKIRFSSQLLKSKIWFKHSQFNENIQILLGILSVIIIAILLIVIFIDWNLFQLFLFKVLPSLFNSWKLDYYNQSLSGFVGRMLGAGGIGSYVSLAFTAIISLTTIFLIDRNGQKDFPSIALKFGIYIVVSLLINNFSWQHHFVWLIIPFFSCVFYIKSNRLPKWYFIFLFFSYLLISANISNPQSLPVILQSHVFYGALILFVVSMRLLFLKEKK